MNAGHCGGEPERGLHYFQESKRDWLYLKKADIVDGKQNTTHVDNSQQQANYLGSRLLWICMHT